jgi:RNA polymerase II subunit A C-terminal domain phosphatase
MTLRRRNPIAVKEAAPPISALSQCKHPAVLNSMCVACGAVIKSKDNDGDSNNLGNDKPKSSLTMTGGQQLKFLDEQAVLDQQNEKAAGLHGARKLALILDLDHTLIHTTASDYAPADIEALQKEDIHHVAIDEKLEGIGTLTKHYIVKKRPHLDDFLHKAHEHFQMTIYTAGTRKYAAAVANMMDPTGKLFSGRIVSRSDIPNDKHAGLEKSLARLFLGDASMAIIVDDREDVWKGEQSRQLYVVRPFVHFKGGHEVNNSAGATSSEDRVISMLHSDPDEITKSNVDDQLLRCLEVSMEIHQEYYHDFDKKYSNDTQLSLKAVSERLVIKRQQVLLGCVVTFSGLIPINERNPAEKCMLWRLVLALGGQVSTEVTPRTTHLLSINTDSKKVSECIKRGNIWIVHPDWLLYSRWSVRKAPEVTFMLVGIPEGGNLPNPKLDGTPLPIEDTVPLIVNTTPASPETELSDATTTNGIKRKYDELGVDSDEENAEFRKSIGKIHKKRNLDKAAEVEANAISQQLKEDSLGVISQEEDDTYGDFDNLICDED